MRKGRKWIALATAAVLSVSICGCAEEEKPTFTGETTEEAEYQDCLNAIAPSVYGKVQGLELEPGTYISIIGKSESTAYWQMVEQGVMQAAEDLNAELGYTGEDKIKVTYNAPEDEENIDEQVNILDEELARYPDVLGIASVDEEACMVQFDLATTNGIPIISLDSGNTYQGILCTVKTDNRDAAKTSASKLADELADESSVILLVHDSASESAREREESFISQMNEEEGKTVAEVIYCDQLDELKKQMIEEQSAESTEDTQDEAEAGDSAASEISEESLQEISDKEVVQYYIEKHGATGVFGTNPDATQLGLKAIEMCDNAEQIVLMGFDAGADQLQALRDGKIAGLIVQNPFGIGYASVVAAARTVLEIGNEAVVDTGYVWVTMDNIENESIQKMLYE
ncbi:MAG: substrate-binding domain-containing protein [Ruminococcus sp.]|nr:substrate-binding domain-containing protein [Ruminococcus sp.]